MATAAEYLPRIERLEKLVKRAIAGVASLFANTVGFHNPVVAVATVDVPVLAGLLAVDGVATVDGSRVFLTNQTTPSQNGIWVTHAGAWTRPSDWASGSVRVVGEQIAVADGGTTFPRFGANWQMTTAATVDAAGGTPIFFPAVDKGTGILDIALVDRWVFLGAIATAVDTTVGAVAALNVTAVTPGAGFGQGNGALTVDGTAGHSASFVIENF